MQLSNHLRHQTSLCRNYVEWQFQKIVLQPFGAGRSLLMSQRRQTILVCEPIRLKHSEKPSGRERAYNPGKA